MSHEVARHALTRMNLREQAVANIYKEGFSADLAQLAATIPEAARDKYENETRYELCEAYGLGRPSQSKPYAFSNGFAIIPVHGSLINRFGSSWGFVTGYNYIRAMHMAALMDDDVKYIIHDHNSYGGEAAGCFELADEIYATRGKKPIIAIVDSNCYSASYALASACDKIIVIPSAGVGSIGVVAMHINMKGFLDKVGVEITFIQSGTHKTDGNPYDALPAEVKADIQKNVDKSRAKFAKLVARNLGLDEKVIYDTEARTYRADDALKLGLVHSIAVPSAALQSIIDEDEGDSSDDTQDDGQDEKAIITNPPDEETMDNNANTPAAGQPQASVPANTGAAATADAATIQANERARVSGILNSEEAKANPALANHLALNTTMSADDAKAALKAAGPAAAAAPAAAGKSTLEQAMEQTAQPNVGADGSVAGAGQQGAGGQQSSADRAAAAMQAYTQATGFKPDEK